MFSPDGALISASAAPYCRELVVKVAAVVVVTLDRIIGAIVYLCVFCVFVYVCERIIYDSDYFGDGR